MRRSVRCSCVRIPKALAFLRNGRYPIPASYRPSPRPIYLSQSLKQSRLDQPLYGSRQNVFLILSSSLEMRGPTFAGTGKSQNRRNFSGSATEWVVLRAIRSATWWIGGRRYDGESGCFACLLALHCICICIWGLEKSGALFPFSLLWTLAYVARSSSNNNTLMFESG
jgi:hypothetical protein